LKKPVFYTEAAFVIGLVLLAFGTALTAYGDFGISMVVAPAYILHLKVSEFLPFFSFGMAEYVLQAIVLLLMTVLLRKFRLVWLLSFVTAVLYGLILDASMLLMALLPDLFALRLVIYILGALVCDVGISLLFRTYLPPEVYELFMKNLARKFGKPVSTVKTVYDCVSMAAAIAMSLLFFGAFRGIGIGSVICALINGALIRAFTRLSDRMFEFNDRFSLRDRFEEREEKV
jgi:uncharacterized membrane protein YczE